MKIPNMSGSPQMQRGIMSRSKNYMNTVLKKFKGSDTTDKSINQAVKDRNKEYNSVKKSINAAKGNKIDTKA